MIAIATWRKAAATAMTPMACWATLTLWYFDHWSEWVRVAAAIAFFLFSAAMLARLTGRSGGWKEIGAFTAVAGLVLLAWLSLEPSNDRDWQPEAAVLPSAQVDGDRVTIHHIRNFEYRSESDFTPAYYDRTFELRRLESVDLVASYWMGPHIAHVFLSFGFDDGGHVAISIEARKERGERYSTVRGFFRQYELYYAVADERDVIRLRTNYRQDPPEQVYLYRLKGTANEGRQLFLAYMERINALTRQPRFYNALTTNCTIDMWTISRQGSEGLAFSWKVVASGHVPEYLYEAGRLDASAPFPALRQASFINDRARDAGNTPEFSRRIRMADVATRVQQ
jgi:uncharacterized protein DUF4105